ncbi:MAG TPA: hypothetical protein VLG40_04650 [Candidatus Saccharimonas sp.]|nr:hypothetical protein [Candidatus Saccharimonas sp.]
MGFVESLAIAATAALARRAAKQAPIPHVSGEQPLSAEMAKQQGLIDRKQHEISVSDAKAGIVILFNITLITNLFKDGQWIIASPLYVAVMGLGLISTGFALWCVKARPPRGEIDDESVDGLKLQLAQLKSILAKRHKAVNRALYLMFASFAMFYVATVSHALFHY